MRVMLRDSYKTEARELKAWFQGWEGSTPEIERAPSAVAAWDNGMRKGQRGRRHLPDVARTGGRRRDPRRGRRRAEALRRSRTRQGGAGADGGARRGSGRLAPGRIHASVFKHPLVSAFDLPTVERDGGAETVNATGAVYRLITDFSDPDKSIVTIGPGSSGQPGSPFYGNLLEGWSRGELFPPAFTRPAVDNVTKYELVLKPR